MRWAAAGRRRGTRAAAASTALRAGVPALAVAALLLPAGSAWAAVVPFPLPGVSLPPIPGGLGPGGPPGPPRASVMPVPPGPAGGGATHAPAPAATAPGAAPGTAKPSPPASPARPPAARPSVSPTAIPSLRPRPSHPAPTHTHGNDHGQDPGPSTGPLRPPRPGPPHQPYGSAHLGERPSGGGQLSGTHPPGGPYGSGPAAGQSGESSSLVPADGGASPDPGSSLAADAQREEGGQAASPLGRGRPVMRMVPLGAGLVLVGLGLGFLGLRLRRP